MRKIVWCRECDIDVHLVDDHGILKKLSPIRGCRMDLRGICNFVITFFELGFPSAIGLIKFFNI